MNTSTTIELGDTAKDTITGYEGVVIAKTLWLNGCIRLAIQPEGLTKEGKIHAIETFDAEQMKLVKAAKPRATAPKGGPKPAPERTSFGEKR